MSTTQAMEQLTQFLDGLLASARNLEQLLNDEKTVLAERSPDELNTITQSKMDLVLQLEASKNVLKTLANSSAAGGEQFSWDGFVAEVDPRGDYGISGKIGELRTLLARCHQANEVNGAVIMAKKRFTDDLVAVLQGKPAKPATETYGKRGQKCYEELSNTLTKA